MTDRRPLVLGTGVVQEIPDSDDLRAGGMRSRRFVADTVTLTATSGVITPDAAAGSVFRHVAAAAVTLAEPTNGTDGQTISVAVQASGAAQTLTVTGAGSLSIPSGRWWVGELRYDATTTTWLLDDTAGQTVITAGGSSSTPADGSVTDVKVANGAAISLDKTADSATRKAMTAAERTKLAGLATVATTGAYVDLTGTVPQSALPSVALTDYLGEVATQAAMLALTGQRGDWCTRTDRGTDWQLITEPASSLASWREHVNPSSPVSSVNGRTGAVTGLAEATDVTTSLSGKQAADADLTAIAALDSSTAGAIASDGAGWIKKTYAQLKTALALVKGDVGLGNVDNTADTAKPISTAAQTALDGKAAVVHTHTGYAPVLTPTATKTAAYTAVAGDLVMVDATSGALTVTLPAAAAGSVVSVKKLDSSTNAVTVAAGSGNTVGSGGAASVPLRLNDQVTTFVASGTNWVITSGHNSLASLDARFAPSAVAISAQTAAYTLALADAGKAVEVTSSSAATVTIPPNSSVAFPIGTVIEVAQIGAGQVTLAAGAGVTVQQRTGAALTLAAQYSVATLRKRASDTWLIAGDTT